MYAMPALRLTTRHINELNACWNNVIRRLFGFSKWKSVSAMLLGLGRLNINHIIMLRRVTSYRHLLYSCDVFLCNVFLMFLKTILKLILYCRRYFYLRLKLQKVSGRLLRITLLSNYCIIFIVWLCCT